MTENSSRGPIENPAAERSEDDKSSDQRNADDAQNPEVDPEAGSDPEADDDPDADEETDVDEVERELLDAMKNLGGANKKVEQYLDGLARDVEKPAPEQTPEQAGNQAPEQVPEKNSDQVKEKPAG